MEKSENITSTKDPLIADLNTVMDLPKQAHPLGYRHQLIQALVIYITHRDHKVWNDGYQKGKRDGKKEAESNTNKG